MLYWEGFESTYESGKIYSSIIIKFYLIIDQLHIHVFQVSYIFVRRPTLTQLQTKG